VPVILPLSGVSLGNGWRITIWKPDSNLHRRSSKMVSCVAVFVFIFIFRFSYSCIQCCFEYEFAIFVLARRRVARLTGLCSAGDENEDSPIGCGRFTIDLTPYSTVSRATMSQPAAKRIKVAVAVSVEDLQGIVEENTTDTDAEVLKNILYANEKSFGLTGRSAATDMAQVSFKAIILHHISRTEGSDKRKLRFPICSGVPGIGKTRILENWSDMVRPAIKAASRDHGPAFNFTCTPDYVLVNYYNGHALQNCEMGEPIMVTFLWRLLFNYFLRGKGDFTQFMKTMMSSGKEPTLGVILDMIVESHGGAVTEQCPLCLFLGVDEYQAVNRLEKNAASDGDEVPYTRQLASMLGAYMNQPNNKVILLPMFAGTDFDIGVGSVSNSSCVDTQRLPMSILSPSEVETMLKSHPNHEKAMKSLCESGTFRRHLFLLGGVPRFAVEYALQAATRCTDGKSVSVQLLEKDFASVWNDRAVKWAANLDARSLLVIAAYAITGQAVKVGGSVTVRSKAVSWKKLADSGICMLEPHGDTANYRVVVPYCALRHCGEFDRLETNKLPLPHRYLSRCLHYMLEHVDNKVYDCEPWQLYETFGACFHAARINSFQILGETSLKVSRFFEGGIGNFSDERVKLRPMEVFRSSDALSNDLGMIVREAGNAHHTRSWIGENTDDAGVIVINGVGGAGVDVFFSLPLDDADSTKLENYVVFLDQRKRVATDSMPGSTAKKLIVNARAAFSNHAHTVVGLFSMFPRAEIPASDLPANSFVISKKQTKAFHCCFWSHPAACPYVDLQEDNKTTLSLLLRGGNPAKRTAAAEIICRRTSAQPVSDMASLEKVAERHEVTLAADAGVWAVF
jgi:hypothetical protein